METTRQTLAVLKSLVDGPKFINLHTAARLKKAGLVENSDPGKSLDVQLTAAGRALV